MPRQTANMRERMAGICPQLAGLVEALKANTHLLPLCAALLLAASLLAAQPLLPQGFATVAGADEADGLALAQDAQEAEVREEELALPTDGAGEGAAAQASDEEASAGEAEEDGEGGAEPLAETAPEAADDVASQAVPAESAADGAAPETAADADADADADSADPETAESQSLEQAALSASLDGYAVRVEGMLPKGARLELARVSDGTVEALLGHSDTEGLAGAFAADIAIVDADGTRWQPSQMDVRVSIENLDLDAEDSYAVVHVLDDAPAIEEGLEASADDADANLVALKDSELAQALPEAAQAAEDATGAADTLFLATLTDGLTLDAGTLSFDAASFSVYVVVKCETAPHVRIMSNLDELAASCATSAFILSYDGGNYLTDAVNAKGALVKTNDVNAAAVWGFEQAEGQANRYYLYARVDGAIKYVHQTGTNANTIELSETEKTAFDVSCPDTTQFVLKVADQSRWLQYSNSGGGIRLYINDDNTTNCFFTLTYAGAAVELTEDYYGLDGKTMSLVFHEESVMAAGLTTTAITMGGSACLESGELVVRPNVLGADGEFLVDLASDLPEWKFTAIAGTEVQYYVTTEIGGAVRYLALGASGLTLESAPTENARISVTSGSGENAGKYRLSVGSYALTLTGTTGSGEYFSSSKSGGSKSWMSLATRSGNLKSGDFMIYSAEKVNLSDDTQVADGDLVVVYTRVWNETTKRYEFYAVNFDGSLIRCYESGDMIQWVGSGVSTAEWLFTEYTGSTGQPTYYYELKNSYSGKCLRPSSASGSATASILRDEDDYAYTERSVNINGRRHGYYYSTILAWDDASYAYLGLKADASSKSVAACAMSEASTFYFAKVKATSASTESDTVKTIDHTGYGITMKMVDLENGGTSHDGAMTKLLGGGVSNNFKQYEATKNLLSTDLASDGYPTIVNNAGHSLSEMFADAQEVNHLFIENTYYSSGYYEFDSTQNFAALDTETGNFTVYSALGTNDTKDGATMKHGQFFPYNTLSTSYASKNAYNLYDALAQELPDSNPRKGEELYLVQDAAGKTDDNATDYYFGVEIEASFTQTENGRDAWGHDIIYEFTGDDDFWLYVDGELVIDLGGIHSALAGSVNYCTGEVVVNGEQHTLRELFESNYRKRNPKATQAEVDEFLAQYFEEGETVFKDYTTHTMRIFYLERGRGASNLHMRFNLASVKPGTVELTKQVTGVDSVESFMADCYFQIYWRPANTADEADAQEEWRLLETTDGAGTANSAITVKYKDSSRDVACEEEHTFQADGASVTYSDVFVLKPGETAVIDFPDDAFEYYIKECYVNTDVYSQVQVNGTELAGAAVCASGSAAAIQGRADFASAPATVEATTRVTFANVVDGEGIGTLTIVNRLYKEDGETELFRADEPGTTFTYRLYLGTENTGDEALSLADMHSYHVKDESGNYCVWDKAAKSFVSLGIADFDALSDAQKASATFTTSMNGSIANIPVGYAVEVREVSYGTKYKVEERSYEIPDGYSLQQYKKNGQANAESPKDPVAGVIGAVASEVEVDNIKGWGLRVYKTWTDEAFMESRDPIYLALFIEGADGSLTMAEGTVERLAFGQKSAYWLIAQLGEHSFDSYVAREVKLSGDADEFAVDPETGLVTGYDAATLVDMGDTTELAGIQAGETSPTTFEYKVSNYEKGRTSATSNVRTDTITNKRVGIDICLSDFEGNALAGGSFELVGGGATCSFSADENGFITMACLKTGVAYTLTQTAAPSGYHGLQGTLTIVRTGETAFTVSGEGVDATYYSVSENHSSSDDISCGKLTIKNKPFSLAVKAQFVSGEGESRSAEPLAGIKYALYRQVTNSATGQTQMDFYPVEGYENLTTDADGMVRLLPGEGSTGTLHAGTYYLHQVEPPSAYEPLEHDVVFSVSETGEVTLADAPRGVALEAADTASGVSNLIVVSYEALATQTLTVTNAVENGTTADTDGTNAFAYEVQLYMPDGRTHWDFDGEGFSDGRASFMLAHGQSLALDVPVNAYVTLTQSEDLGYATSHSANGGASAGSFVWTGTIASGADQQVDYTNVRRTTQVKVTKKVVGAGGSFAFTAKLTDSGVACEGYALGSAGGTAIVTGANGEATFALAPATNGSKDITLTIPYGATLTLAEEDCSADYATKVTKGGTTAVARQAQFASAETKTTGTLSVTFTNTARIPIVPSAVKRVLVPAVLCFGCGGFLAFGYAASARKKNRATCLPEGGAKR